MISYTISADWHIDYEVDILWLATTTISIFIATSADESSQIQILEIQIYDR